MPEIRQQIVDGKLPYEILLNEKVGEIKAQIIERDGQILMVKDCPKHGHFEDVMAVDVEFFRHLEETFPGRDMRAHNDEKLHNHGSSTVKYGRGSVLTVDLTNRCNMMCDPCFMDANQVGFVHELGWEDIKTMLDNAITIKPRRQMSVQFSGGEPTLSPHFLEAVAYARKVGYNSVQAATNGIEFAKSPEFCKQAAEAGLRYAYLQFDGIGNAANSHRAVGNLFDVKLRAIENLHSAGVEIVPVVTIVNGVNNEQVGRIIQFALDNPKRISFLSFQPVSFTGRDEAITDERRHAQRYTLSHLAHDVKKQTGLGEPARDWFPISFMGTFSDWADVVHGSRQGLGIGELRLPSELRRGHGADDRQRDQGSGSGDQVPLCRPDRQGRGQGERCGTRRTLVEPGHGAGAGAQLRSVPVADALQVHRSAEEVRQDLCGDQEGGGRSTASRVPDRTLEDVQKRRADRWNFLFVAGMWFQDLFNYDFRRTEQCIIPYATQEGEISFCAYNTGVGWRNIIEKMHMTATLTKWYEEHGRHEIFAGGKQVALASKDHTLVLNQEHVHAGRNTTLDEQGIAKTAREEKFRARDAKLKQDAENARMVALYRQHVLGEKAPEVGGFVPAGQPGRQTRGTGG